MFERVESILIVKLSSIGDVVHSLPVLAALRRRFPEAYIAWAVGPAAADVVAGSPHLSETFVVGGSGDHGPGATAIPPLRTPLQLARALREHAFDLAVDMQGLFKSALLAYLSGARLRVGFRNLQEGAFLLNNRRIVPDRRDVHAVEAYLEFAKALEAAAEPLDFTIATTEADRAAVDQMLDGREPLIALIPGARWLSKRWPPERFSAVAEGLADEFGVTSVIVGGPGDRDVARQIAGSARAGLLDLSGRTTLKQLADLFGRCRAVIANDTGPMHIAAAVGAPVVAIFGPTDARRLAPYGEGHVTITADLPCAPCRRRQCRPLKCMEAISTERVLDAARRTVESSAREGGRAAS